jgi:hypothetical protein
MRLHDEGAWAILLNGRLKTQLEESMPNAGQRVEWDESTEMRDEMYGYRTGGF